MLRALRCTFVPARRRRLLHTLRSMTQDAPDRAPATLESMIDEAWRLTYINGRAPISPADTWTFWACKAASTSLAFMLCAATLSGSSQMRIA